MMFRIALVAAASLLAAPASAQIPAVDHGLLPGSDRARATSISADGRVVLVESGIGSSGPRRSFLRTPTAARVPLVAPAPWDRAHGTAMDRAGRTVAGTLSRVGSAVGSAFLWTEATGAVELTDLSGAGFTSFSDVRLSEDGAVVAGTATDGAGAGQPFLWSAATGLVLPAASSPTDFTQQLLSGDGTTLAGWYKDAGGLRRPCRWSLAGGFEPLGTVLPGGELFRCSAISRDGDTIVGIEVEGSSTYRSFRWSPAGGIEEVIPLPGSGRVLVENMTPSGDTLVGSFLPPAPLPPRVTTFRMRSGQAPDVISTPDYPFATAGLIDDAGAVIVGLAYFPQHGEGTPFVWSEGAGLRWLEGYRHFGTALSADGRHGVGVRRGISFSAPTASVSWDLSAPDGPWAGPPHGTAVPSSSGRVPRAVAQGSRQVASGDLTITALDLPPETFCMLLSAPDRAQLPGFGGGLGTLFLGGPLARFDGPGEVRRTNELGTFSLRVDPGAFPTPGGVVALQPGDVRSFQVWYRDVDPAPTSNLTPAVEVTFE